jgi:[ribosomal protein S5]-alanine N-acetyltransferase
MLVRHFEPGDLDDLHRLTGRADVMRFVGDLSPLSREQAHRMIQEAMGRYETHGFSEYAVVDRESGALVGYGGFAVLPERDCVEIDYIFFPEHWGQGLATELAGALVEYAFDTLDLDVVGASFDPGNHASMRVAAKVGLRYERHGHDEHGLPTVYYIARRP